MGTVSTYLLTYWAQTPFFWADAVSRPPHKLAPLWRSRASMRPPMSPQGGVWWAALCAEHSVSLKAAALAFAFLPACVSRVAIGLAEAALVAETVALLAEAKAVPIALWRDAVAKGLLAEGLVEGL